MARQWQGSPRPVLLNCVHGGGIGQSCFNPSEHITLQHSVVRKILITPQLCKPFLFNCLQSILDSSFILSLPADDTPCSYLIVPIHTGVCISKKKTYIIILDVVNTIQYLVPVSVFRNLHSIESPSFSLVAVTSWIWITLEIFKKYLFQKQSNGEWKIVHLLFHSFTATTGVEPDQSQVPKIPSGFLLWVAGAQAREPSFTFLGIAAGCGQEVEQLRELCTCGVRALQVAA